MLKLSSQTGCSLELVADLNGDGIADFVLSGGSAGADVESLYLSSPTGWTVAAQSTATN